MARSRAAPAYVAQGPRSPAARPAAAVTTPTTAMVTRTPTAKARETRLLFNLEPRTSLPETYPTTSGTPARWHGLRSTLAIPHPTEAARATPGDADRAWPSVSSRAFTGRCAQRPLTPD